MKTYNKTDTCFNGNSFMIAELRLPVDSISENLQFRVLLYDPRNELPDLTKDLSYNIDKRFLLISHGDSVAPVFVEYLPKPVKMLPRELFMEYPLSNKEQDFVLLFKGIEKKNTCLFMDFLHDTQKVTFVASIVISHKKL